MDLVMFLVVVALGGLLVGGLARLAVPGPDPMPLWKTAVLGVAGSLLGGLAVAVLGLGAEADDPGSAGGSFLAAIAGASLLLVLHRRYVQKRPITGPNARRRLGKARAGSSGGAVDELAELVRLRERGAVDAAEFERRKAELVARI